MRYTLMTILALLTVYPCRSAVPDLAKTAGVSGGVLVRIGCDEPVELMDICIDDTCLVQAIDTDPEKVAAARAAIPAEKYGRVSAILWDGKRLPYVDNFVNLIVVPGVACRVSSEEIRRVLAPRGVAIINLKSAIRTPQSKVVRGWRTYRKPVPDGIDDWTHFLHSPGNNAVASDRIVAPPRSMQWVGGPRYARHHDKMSSVSAVVSADGRVFSIVDLAPPVSILTPPQWTLVARDAFNGTVLWRRPVTKWHPHMHGLKSGPADLPRKLVAVGNRVYVTLEIYGPVHSLDATTGKTLHTYEGTAGAEEILVADNTLFVQVNEARLAATKSPPRGRKKAGDADFADPFAPSWRWMQRRANNAGPWNTRYSAAHWRSAISMSFSSATTASTAWIAQTERRSGNPNPYRARRATRPVSHRPSCSTKMSSFSPAASWPANPSAATGRGTLTRTTR